jgi:ribosomal protein S4
LSFYKSKFKYVNKNYCAFFVEKFFKLSKFRKLTRQKWKKIKKIYLLRYRYRTKLYLSTDKKKKKRIYPYSFFQHSQLIRGKKFKRTRFLKKKRKLKIFLKIKNRCCKYFGRERLKLSTFRRLALSSKRLAFVYNKNYGSVFHHKLESRLVFFLVRLGFISNQYQSRYCLKSSLIIHKDNLLLPYNYLLKKGDFFNVDKGFYYYYYKNFLSTNYFLFLKFTKYFQNKIFSVRKKKFFINSLDMCLLRKNKFLSAYFQHIKSTFNHSRSDHLKHFIYKLISLTK